MIDHLLRMLLAVAVIVVYIFLARKHEKWRFLSYGPILYAVLVILFYIFLYTKMMTPIQLNYFNAWIGIVGMLCWLIVGFYKLGAPHANL